MHIIIRATPRQKEELLQKGFNKLVTIDWREESDSIHYIQADALFDLTFKNDDVYSNEFFNDTIVFANAVGCICREINHENYIRLNAWHGFLNREVFELSCCSDNYKMQAERIFNELGWKYIWVADDYGLVAARIITMIINEAYYALDENVSSKEQIDIAMKLGVNYPFGPFEWSRAIGLKNVYSLLKKLSGNDNRYTVSEKLREEALNDN